MIEAVRLTKRFGDKTAVDQLSFTVRPGVVTGFLGPNGRVRAASARHVTPANPGSWVKCGRGLPAAVNLPVLSYFSWSLRGPYG
jgi:hypothetical protein